MRLLLLRRPPPGRRSPGRSPPRCRVRGSGRGRGRRATVRTRSRTAPVAGPGCSGARRSSARAPVSTSIASTRASPSMPRRSLRAAAHPIDTWSSCIADDGIESTDAGTASLFSSETIPAAAYCAIMRPESTPTSCARNGGRPWLRVWSSARSVRRSEIDATSATAIARKSSTYATGAPWKLPLDSTRPSSVRTGLSTAEDSSRKAIVRAWSTVSRAAPCTCGAQRSEYASCTRVQTAGSRCEATIGDPAR